MNGFCEAFDSVGISSFLCVSDTCGAFISPGKSKQSLRYVKTNKKHKTIALFNRDTTLSHVMNFNKPH